MYTIYRWVENRGISVLQGLGRENLDIDRISKYVVFHQSDKTGFKLMMGI